MKQALRITFNRMRQPYYLKSLTNKQFQYFAKKDMEMPALSPTMDVGNILKWVKKEGDKIEAGDVICEVETDKATVGFEVQEPGYLAKIIKPEGSKGVKVGEIVAIVVSKQSEIGQYANSSVGNEVKQEIKVEQPIQKQNIVGKKQQSTSKQYPKHTKLGLPALSPTMERGNLMGWIKKEGDRLEAGDTLCEVETDKATVGFEIQESGYLAKILVPAGTKDLALGTVLAIIVGKKEHIAPFSDYTDNPKASTQNTNELKKETSEATATIQSNQQQQKTSIDSRDRIFASPLARQFANENNVDLKSIKQGTGVEGSIVKQDVQSYLKSATPVQQAPVQKPTQTIEDLPKTAITTPPTQAKPVLQAGATAGTEPNPFQDIEITNIRKVIANRLLESKTTIPHYYLTMKITMDNTLKLREELNKISKIKISVNDFLVKASALALRDVPEVNSQWHKTHIRKFSNADISIAVSTDTGLITPIVFNAAAKGLSSIAELTKNLAEKARANKLKPQEFQGGTFSISNLGMFGIDNFCAVINPPQACILAVGKTAKVVVPHETDETKFKLLNQMEVTLSCDHRVVDGAVGAQWLQKFKNYLENPNTMLL